MKQKLLIRGIASAVLCAVALASLLVGAMLLPAAEVVDTTPTLSAVNGGFTFGADALKAPVKQGSEANVYYAPASYVYFGESAEEPILFRVLDPTKDNTGATGAMFLMAENTAAWGDVRYALQSSTNDWMDFENMYQMCWLAVTTYHEGPFLTGYRTSNNLTAMQIPMEWDYLRPITKNDDEEQMQGAFGYHRDTSTHSWYAPNNYYPFGDEDQSLFFGDVLEEQRVFLLSVEELLEYVGTYNGAPGLADENGKSWWLRTALSDVQGNLVGVVRPDGTVEDASCFEAGIGARFGLNVETEEIAFLHQVETKNGAPVYKIAFHAPVYQNTETPFEAEILDVRGQEVVLSYTNAINNSSQSIGEECWISVIVRDENGNVTYYGTIERTAVSGTPANGINTNLKGVASFLLPEDFDHENDTVSVFWEKRADEKSVAYVSNMVELECVHMEQTPANCQTPAVCALCHESYGYRDLYVHLNMDSYAYDAETNEHWTICADCGETSARESCTFGEICTDVCVCGNDSGFSHEQHAFDENGICTRDPSHTEDFVSTGGAYASVSIQNEGQFLSFAKYFNSGKTVGHVTLEEDLDFTGIEFIPVGTETRPFYCFSFDGGGHTVRGITYVAGNGVAAIFPYVDSISVGNLTVCDSTFRGRIASVLVGVANQVSASSANLVKDCTVEGSALSAAVVASGTGGSLRAFGSYRVTNGDGKYLSLVAEGDVTLSDSCWYLAEETGANGAWSAEAVANGELAFYLKERINGRGARAFQILDGEGAQPHPVYSLNAVTGGYVYRAETCEGTVVYFNDPALRDAIEAHTYLAPADEVPQFTFDTTAYPFTATLRVLCDKCGHVGELPVSVFNDVKSNSNVGVICILYYATVTLGDTEYRSEQYRYISTPLESVIGMTPVEKVYDGQPFSPEDLMDNHRLVSSPAGMRQYEVYFLNSETGEKYWHEAEGFWDYSYALSVDAVGSYDLVVEGRREFEEQRVVYERALTIKKASVTVIPQRVSRPENGTAVFEPLYELAGDDLYLFEDWLTVSFSQAASAAPGVYTLQVTASVKAAYAAYVDLTLASSTVEAVILPAYRETVGEHSYPDTLTYGERFPVPTPAHFGLGEDRVLSYEWYRAEIDWYGDVGAMTRVDEPTDVGSYLLDILVLPAEGYAVATRIQVTVQITPALLGIELILPDGVELTPAPDEWSRPSLTLISGQEISWRITGLLEGDTAEALGISSYLMMNGYEIDALPTQPTEDGEPYWVSVRVRDGENYLGTYFELQLYVLADPNADVTRPAPEILAENRTEEEGGDLDLRIYFDPLDYAPEDENYVIYSYDLQVFDGSEYVYLFRNESANATDFEGFPYCDLTVSGGGEYRLTVRAQVAYSGEDEAELCVIDFTVAVMLGEEMLDRLESVGIYEITLDAGDYGTAHGQVILQRKITMYLKEQSFTLTDQTLPYVPELVVTTANSTYLAGHVLSDVTVAVDTMYGKAYVASIKVLDASGNDVSALYRPDTAIDGWRHTEADYNVVHIFDNSCDETCEFCDFVRVGGHTMGTPANCQHGAICAVCDAVYTEPNENRHVLALTAYYPSIEDLSVHNEIYVCCGAVKSTAEHTLGTPATCTTLTLCAECGWGYGELNSDNHESAPVYALDANDPTRHSVTYPCCGAVTYEAHAGGAATCQSGAICEHCKSAYGEKNPLNHAAEPTYTPDGDAHCAAYACCGVVEREAHTGGAATCTEAAVCEHCGSAYGTVDANAHTSTEILCRISAENASVHEYVHACCEGRIRTEFHTGGVANCATAAICEACGSEWGVKDPDNHASEETVAKQSASDPAQHDVMHACCGVTVRSEAHTGGTATCTHGTLCEVCGADYGTPTEHVYSNDCDAVCDICEVQTRPRVLHVDMDQDQLCDSCGESLESSTEEPEDTTPEDSVSGTEPEDTTPDGTAPEGSEPSTPPAGNEPQANGGMNETDGVMLTVSIAAASVTVAGAGGFCVWWFAFQKKSWLDLIKPFLKR